VDRTQILLTQEEAQLHHRKAKPAQNNLRVVSRVILLSTVGSNKSPLANPAAQ